MLAANAMREAAEKITEAASMIVNCMQELKPEIKSLANRNYREIQLSANALKQLVSFCLFCFQNFIQNTKLQLVFFSKNLGFNDRASHGFHLHLDRRSWEVRGVSANTKDCGQG